MEEPPKRRAWTSFTAGLFVGLLIGIPPGMIVLIILAQILTVMTSLP